MPKGLDDWSAREVQALRDACKRCHRWEAVGKEVGVAKTNCKAKAKSLGLHLKGQETIEFDQWTPEMIATLGPNFKPPPNHNNPHFKSLASTSASTVQDPHSDGSSVSVTGKKRALSEGSEVAAGHVGQPAAGAERTFERSRFLETYGQPEARPQFQHELMAAVNALIRSYAAANGLSRVDADAFFTRVQRNACVAGGAAEFTNPADLMHVAVRLWTSAETLSSSGRELCAILNEAIRTDAEATVGHAAMLAHAINAFCVTRRAGGAAVRFPPDNRTYRGSAMPRVHRAFFEPGTQYRAPMFVATSFDEDISIDSFLSRLDPPSAHQQPPWQEPVLWTFHFNADLPPSKRCVHVNYIDKTDGTVHGEDEFLFAPYSTFTVRSVKWEDAPVVNAYTTRAHRIEVDVAPDNRKAPPDLPLAPWC